MHVHRDKAVVCIPVDKWDIRLKVYLISPQKHMLWVLIGIATMWQFQLVPITYVFLRNKKKRKNIVT